MIAKEVMSSKLVCLTENASLEQAVEVFQSHRFKVIPVVDHLQRPVGLLTQTILLQGLVQKLDPQSEVTTVSDIKKNLLDPVTIRDFESVASIFQMLKRAACERVLVVDQYSKVIGVIAPLDVISSLNFGERIELESKANIAMLKKHFKQMTGFIDGLPFMTICVNFMHEIDQVNKPFCDYLRYDGRLLYKKPINQIFLPSCRARVERLIHQMHDCGYSGGINMNVLNSSGDLVPVLVQGRSFANMDHSTSYTLVLQPTDTEHFMASLRDKKD